MHILSKIFAILSLWVFSAGAVERADFDPCTPVLVASQRILSRLVEAPTKLQNRVLTRAADDIYNRKYKDRVDFILKLASDRVEPEQVQYLEATLNHFQDLRNLDLNPFYRRRRYLDGQIRRIKNKLTEIALNNNEEADTAIYFNGNQPKRAFRKIIDKGLKEKFRNSIRFGINNFSSLEFMKVPKTLKKDGFVYKKTEYRVVFAFHSGPNDGPSVVFLGTHEAYNKWLNQHKSEFFE